MNKIQEEIKPVTAKVVSEVVSQQLGLSAVQPTVARLQKGFIVEEPTQQPATFRADSLNAVPSKWDSLVHKPGAVPDAPPEATFKFNGEIGASLQESSLHSNAHGGKHPIVEADPNDRPIIAQGGAALAKLIEDRFRNEESLRREAAIAANEEIKRDIENQNHCTERE